MATRKPTPKRAKRPMKRTETSPIPRLRTIEAAERAGIDPADHARGVIASALLDLSEPGQDADVREQAGRVIAEAVTTLAIAAAGTALRQAVAS